ERHRRLVQPRRQESRDVHLQVRAQGKERRRSDGKKGQLRTERSQGAQVSSRAILESVGHELKTNPPKQLARTRRKFGASDAAKQRTAILLSKARKLGARIPSSSSSSKRSK